MLALVLLGAVQVLGAQEQHLWQEAERRRCLRLHPLILATTQSHLLINTKTQVSRRVRAAVQIKGWWWVSMSTYRT